MVRMLLLVGATTLAVGIAAPAHPSMHWMATIEMVWVHVSILRRHAGVALKSVWMHHRRRIAWCSVWWRSGVTMHVGRRRAGNGHDHIAAGVIWLTSTPTTGLLLRVMIATTVVVVVARWHVRVMVSWVVMCWVAVVR